MQFDGRSAAATLLVIDAHVRAPRHGRALRDYDVLHDVTGADVVDRDDVAGHLLARTVARLLGRPAGLALLAAVRAPRYDAVYCDAESYGLLLGLLAVLLRWRTRVTVLMHMPRHPAKRMLLRTFGAHRGMAAIVVNGSAVRDELHQQLGVPSAKIHIVPMAVDVDFWSDERAARGSRPPCVASAGQEFRDYPTLVAAARPLDVQVRIAAGSPYSTRPDTLSGLDLPPNVEQVRCDTPGLRDVYAGSALVVVPLSDVVSVAGVTTIVEAMAMGKCVVTTRSLGQADTVADRRKVLRTPAALPTGGALAGIVEPEDADLRGATGFYVPVADVQELRRVLAYLLSHPEVCAELGARGRRVAERVHDVRVVAPAIAALLHAPRRGAVQLERL